MESSELYAQEHHWGDSPIDVHARDLPALKARYLIRSLAHTGRVLEIGCGGGRVLNTVAEWRPQLQLYGCDIRPLQRDPARFRFSLVPPDETVTLPYDAETFDAVVMFDSLEHFIDPAAALRAARRLLRPRGRLVSFTPLEGQPRSFYRMFRRLLGDDLYVLTKEHVQAFSERDLMRLLEADFEVIDREYVYHLIGQLMDATLFASLKWTFLRDRFWRENPFYAEVGDGTHMGGRRSVISSMLRAANAIAYEESQAMRRHRFGSAGLLFVATTR